LQEIVYADQDPLAGIDLALIAIRGVRNLSLGEALLQCWHHPSQSIDPFEILEATALHSVGECLDEVAAPQRIDGVGHAALVSDDLLRGYREESITMQHLMRYTALCGSQHYGPMGTPWRASPLGESAQAVRATCLKGYYLDVTTRENVNTELRTALSTRRLPNIRDRDQSMLGHLTTPAAANPLSHGTPPRKHPRMLPDGTREAMLDADRTARDRMIVTWLSDSGMRITLAAQL
jgi:hypothetical protein